MGCEGIVPNYLVGRMHIAFIVTYMFLVRLSCSIPSSM